MARRALHPSGRPQQQKSKERVGEAFSIFRPLHEESAGLIYEIVKSLMSEKTIPESGELTPEGLLHVTYIEKRKLTRQLQGLAAGFDARGVIDRAQAGDSMDEPLLVSLGRASLMGSRKDTVAVKLEHDQTVADEWGVIADALAAAHVPGIRRSSFKPHISLVRYPGHPYDERIEIARTIQDVLPSEIMLNPIASFPPNPRLRRNN